MSIAAYEIDKWVDKLCSTLKYLADKHVEAAKIQAQVKEGK